MNQRVNDNCIYYGIDLTDDVTLFSYLDPFHDLPQTVSPVVGSGIFTIPTCMAKGAHNGAWLYGADAKRAVSSGEAYEASHIFRKSLDQDTVLIEGLAYDAIDLLTLFITKLLSLAPYPAGQTALGRIVFTVEKIDRRVMDVFDQVADRMKLDRGDMMVIDHVQSFYYYVLNQKPQIFLGDVALFDYSTQEIRCCIMHRNQRSMPQTVTMARQNLGEPEGSRDEAFDAMVTCAMKGRRVTGVYLIGSGFEGDWMKISLKTLCEGRRVFMGKNLYTRGACYCGKVHTSGMDWPFVYISESDLKINVSVNVADHGRTKLFTLLSAGENLYEAGSSLECILEGTPEVTVQVQTPDTKRAVLTVIALDDMPARPAGTCRIRITAKAVSDRSAEITISDLGFGEMFPSTGSYWSHIVGDESGEVR